MHTLEIKGKSRNVLRILQHFLLSAALILFSTSNALGNEVKSTVPTTAKVDGVQATQEQTNSTDKVILSCAEVPLIFDKCLPALCQSKTQFGQVDRKIIGLDASGNCQYVERSASIGGMNCLFLSGELPNIQNVLGAYYSTLEQGQAADATQSKLVQKIYANHCKVSLDNDIHNIASLDGGAENIADTNINPLKPAVEGSPQALITPGVGNEVAAIPSPAPIADESNTDAAVTDMRTPTSQDNKNDEPNMLGAIPDNKNAVLPTYGAEIAANGSGVRSVVFHDEELQAVLEAVRSYEAKNGQRRDRGSLQGFSPIYLNSILHLKDDRWSIWLNDTKVKNNKVNQNLKVLGVESNRVFLRWIVDSVDKLAPGWRSRAKKIDDNHYSINGHPIEVSMLSPDSGAITFALQINQSFIPQQLRVIEGHFATEGTVVTDTVKQNGQNDAPKPNQQQ